MNYTIVPAAAVVALVASAGVSLRAASPAFAEAAAGKPGDSLVEAARRGDRAAVRALVQKGVDVNVAAADGTRPLHWAVHRNDADLVDALLKAGANAKAVNRYEVAPLSLAAQNGSARIVERLIAAGADPNGSLPGGETVLMTAARTGNVAALTLLLDKGANVDVRNPRGQTALMWAAATKHNAEAVRLLVARGARVSERTPTVVVPPEKARLGVFDVAPPTGFTPLLFAVRAGNIDAVRVLLDAGADVNDTLSDGQSALVLALANTHWELADVMLDRGANPNLAGAGWNALHQAIRWRRPNPNGGFVAPIPTGSIDSINVVKKMIAKGVNVNARMTVNGMQDGQRHRLIRTGATAFFLAAKSADVEAMQVLLAAGADATIPNFENTTPLMVASGVALYHAGEDGGSMASDADDVLAAVKLCLEHGNDVNAADVFGYTALHGAAFRGLPAIIDYLAGKGARLDAKTIPYEVKRQKFLSAGEKAEPDARVDAGWTPLAIASGFSYADFYTQQPKAMDALKTLMQARGLSIENQTIDPRVCLDCIQTGSAASRAFFYEREKKAQALAASHVGER